MKQPLRVLLVEDSDDDSILLLRQLKRGGYEVVHKRVESAGEVNDALAKEVWDVVISDYAMPGFSGLDALRIVQEHGLDIPFILVSGQIGEDMAVSAMKAGAHDYLMKDKLARLVPAVERELREEAGFTDAQIAECFASVAADPGPLDLMPLFGGGRRKEERSL